MQLWSRLVAAYKAFWEPGLLSDPLKQIDGEFGDFDYRQLRYAIYWSFYGNDAYREIHDWAAQYKVSYGLYKYVRTIYNPTYRLGEFWKTHLWGGALDADAGDGEEVPSAFPIVTGNPALRPAIARLWRWSNWQINKDTVPLYGSIFGDVGLMVVDDVEREKIYLKFIHPGTIRAVELDPFNNVKSYIIEEGREDPSGKQRTVTFREEATRDGELVIYRTYLNDDLYDWAGDGRAEWVEPYGFIPLVLAQHNNVGLDWGWSEIQGVRSKIHEVDDLASKLSDQGRKMVDAPWLFAGVDQPDSSPTASETSLTGSAAQRRPQPGREEIPTLYGATGATATPLVAPLDITAMAGYISDILAELERDLPELQKDIWTASGDASGRALRIARQRVETKVLQRRANYDDALVRAQQMAIAIGGLRGYEGFEPFSLESFAAGALDHSIGPRAVFAADPLDALELRRAELEVERLEAEIERQRTER